MGKRMKVVWILALLGVAVLCQSLGTAQAADGLYFSDDFENGLDKWDYSGQDWAVLDADFRSSNHSITDSPLGNYSGNANSMIALIEPVNLTEATSPILTFWHKYSIDNNTWYSTTDYGIVQISQDSGLTWTDLVSYSGYVSSWTKVMLDLTAYKDKPVLIRFLMQETGDGEVAGGWSIDDVEIKEVGTNETTLSASISPLAGGTVTGNGINCPADCSETTHNNWIFSGRDWTLIDTDFKSSSHSITDSPLGNYKNNANSIIEFVNPIDVSTATTPVLTFWHKYSIDNNTWYSTCDYGIAQISQDGGITWTEIVSYTGYVSSWTKVMLDLTTYKDKPVMVRFIMKETGDGEVAGGWSIDDVEIKDLANSHIYFSDNFEGSDSLPDFSDVTLTANPAPGFMVDQWTGCNSTSGDTCTVNRYVSKNVSVTFKVAPPKPPIVSGITPTNDTTPEWSWVPGGGGNGTFRYNLDSANLMQATRTYLNTYTPAAPLSEGKHTLYVWERNADGGWSSPGSKAIVIDTTAPAAPVVGGTTPTKDDTPRWGWVSGAGGNQIFRYNLDSDDLSGAVETTARSYVPATALAEGSHTLYVQERDKAGNWSVSGSLAIVIDKVAPGAPGVSGTTPTNSMYPKWTWTPGGGGNGTFRYKLDSSAMTGATETTALSYTPVSALGEGKHTLYVQECDAAGNWSLSGSKAIVVDLTKPGAPLVRGTTPTASSKPTWAWVSGRGGNGTFRYNLDNWNMAGATETTAKVFTPATALSEGKHTLYVQERDGAGNWSASGSLAIIIDLTKPAAPIVSGASPTSDTTPTWSWVSGGGGNGAFRYNLDNFNMAGATPTTALDFTPLIGLGVGKHTLYVQERDEAGNWSALASKVVVIN